MQGAVCCYKGQLGEGAGGMERVYMVICSAHGPHSALLGGVERELLVTGGAFEGWEAPLTVHAALKRGCSACGPCAALPQGTSMHFLFLNLTPAVK